MFTTTSQVGKISAALDSPLLNSELPVQSPPGGINLDVAVLAMSSEPSFCRIQYHHESSTTPCPMSTTGTYLRTAAAQIALKSTSLQVTHNQPLPFVRRSTSCPNHSPHKTAAASLENESTDVVDITHPRIPASQPAKQRADFRWSQLLRIHLSEIHSSLPSKPPIDALM